MARGKVSTTPFASLLAHPGKPIFISGRILTWFAPIRALFAYDRSRHAPIAIEHQDEEWLQCKRVEFANEACSRVRAKRRPPVALVNSLPAQFITYQTQNSVQSNGASSCCRSVISRANEATDLRRNAASRSNGFCGFGRLVFSWFLGFLQTLEMTGCSGYRRSVSISTA